MLFYFPLFLCQLLCLFCNICDVSNNLICFVKTIINFCCHSFTGLFVVIILLNLEIIQYSFFNHFQTNVTTLTVYTTACMHGPGYSNTGTCRDSSDETCNPYLCSHPKSVHNNIYFCMSFQQHRHMQKHNNTDICRSTTTQI